MIDNPRSPRVRAVAKLAKKSRRHDARVFLVEGPQAVREALAWDGTNVEEVFATDVALAKHPELARLADAAGVDIDTVSDDVLAQMADTTTPQGVVSVHRMFDVTLDQAVSSGAQCVAILEQVSDPGNAGTIIRVAAAAGVDAVIITDDSVDIYNPKVVRATTGSLFHLPVIPGVDLTTALTAMRQRGLRVLAADTSGVALPALVAAGALASPTAWLFGNEAHGLDEATLSSVDQVVSIPRYGPVESMNLATAAAVCLFQSAFALRPTPPDHPVV